MAEKRKSTHKRPSRCKRNRSSTPALDILSPYLSSPELSPPILAIQTRPAYSSASFDSSLNSASSSIGYAPYSSMNPTSFFDLSPIPSNSSLFHTESHVVQDLSVRLTAQSALPPQIDWYGPSMPSTSYMVSTQSNRMTSTSGNSQSGVQRFFEEFKLPDYTLDSFSGKLLDVVANTAFSSGNVQVELHHAIMRLMVCCIYILNFGPFYIRLFYIRFPNFIYDLIIFLDCLTYLNQECVILLTAKLI